jgi:hypothetical protein
MEVTDRGQNAKELLYRKDKQTKTDENGGYLLED